MALSLSLAVAKRVPQRLLITTPHTTRRFLSESSSLKKNDKETQVDDDKKGTTSPPQDFVKVTLEPGEWDDARTDPIDRPPWKSNAKIISAEDFANRPQVGWGDEFDSMRDAMVTLSWLDQEDTDKVYQSYLDMMGTMQEKEGVTSHEYVIRVVAQKYNLNARRVAAIVQLAHNEDQIRKEGGTIHYEIANEVDQQIKEHIRNAYEGYGEEPPTQFVEDPFGVGERGDPLKRVRGVAPVEDLYDLDDKMSQTLVREQEEARLAIDSHVYIEDVDDSTFDAPIDANCQKLLNTNKQETALSFAERPSDQRPLPESGTTKERFKYVAQIIDTRDKKKQKKKKKKRRTDGVEGNTLVEQGGLLRVATVAEVKETSWKPERNIKEFTYAGVKKAWVDRTVHGKTGTWGRFEDVKKVEEPKEEKAEEELVSAVEDFEDVKKVEQPKEEKAEEELASAVEEFSKDVKKVEEPEREEAEEEIVSAEEDFKDVKKEEEPKEEKAEEEIVSAEADSDSDSSSDEGDSSDSSDEEDEQEKDEDAKNDTEEDTKK